MFGFVIVDFLWKTLAKTDKSSLARTLTGQGNPL
jgi:hypothetical protein